MNRKQHLMLLTLSAAVATLSACGGGGGGDEVGSPAPSPAPAPAPGPAPSPGPAPAPAPGPLGLDPATGTLGRSPSQAATLVSKAREGYSKAAGGVASRKQGTFTPGLPGGSGPYSCPGGGTVSLAPGAAGTGTYSYSGCVIDGVTYNGTGAVSYTVDGTTLQTVQIAQGGITATVDGSSVTLTDRVTCGLSSGAMVCVGHYGGNSWGNDFNYANAIANGTFQCECESNKWNVTFANFAAASGTADAAAAIGTARIVRNSSTNFTVTITVGGVSETFTVNTP